MVRIRPVIHEGDFYRLQRLEEFGAPVIQYVLPNRREAVYSVAVREHQVGWYRPPTFLKNLDPAAIYIALNQHNAEIHRASGYELMTRGLPGDAALGIGYSRTLHLKQI